MHALCARVCADLCSRGEDGGPSWAWVHRRIVETLQAHPGGLTEAVLATHALAEWEEARGARGSKRRRRDAGPLAAPRLPLQQDLVSVKQLAYATDQPLVLQAAVAGAAAVVPKAAADAQPAGRSGPPSPSAIALQLDDGTAGSPVGLYLPSKLHPMAHVPGGLLATGRTLRLAAHGRPPLGTLSNGGAPAARLLPPAALVSLISAAELSSLDSLPVDAECSASPAYDLSTVRPSPSRFHLFFQICSVRRRSTCARCNMGPWAPSDAPYCLHSCWPAVHLHRSHLRLMYT